MSPRLRLFVYGTLMPGQMRYPDLLEPFVSSHRPATVADAWLFLLPEGYPALLTPPAPCPHPPGEVHGVLCELPGEFDWSELDAWEDYRPDNPSSLYLRRQLEVIPEGDAGPTSAWTYVFNPRRTRTLLQRATVLPQGRFAPTEPS